MYYIVFTNCEGRSSNYYKTLINNKLKKLLDGILQQDFWSNIMLSMIIGGPSHISAQFEND